MNKDKGILIIAAGHAFYGRMAHNLAASIKSVEPDMPIALRWAGSALNHLSLYNINEVFDSIEKIPEDHYLQNGKNNWIRTKTFIYQLSPFDKTLFLDADTIWLPKRKPSDLFNELENVTITFENYIRYDLSNLKPKDTVWANISEIKAAYKLERGWYYGLQSEMVYFTRTEAINAYFETVREVYDNLKVKTTEFAGFLPDEIAFSIAAALHGIEPHVHPYYPAYWHPVQRKAGRSTIPDNHYLLSVGGAFQTDQMKDYYNKFASIAFRKLAMDNPWKFMNKRAWLQERKIL